MADRIRFRERTQEYEPVKMPKTKMKGYRIERKVKMTFERHGWKVVRAGASFGIADLVCIKNGKCLLLQVKSTKNRTLYYYGPMEKKVEGFPFYLIVDFGYGRTRVIHPKKRIGMNDGTDLEEFLRRELFCRMEPIT